MPDPNKIPLFRHLFRRIRFFPRCSQALLASTLCCLFATSGNSRTGAANEYASNTPNGSEQTYESVPLQTNKLNSERKPLEGRVEVLQKEAQPTLPADLLNPSPTANSLPSDLCGKWYGSIQVTQMQTYPQAHDGDRYWQEFIREINSLVKERQRGQVVLEFKKSQDNELHLLSSDVFLRGGARLQLTSGKGQALVRGGFNIPRTVADRVTLLPDSVVEQTRLDAVTIVDRAGQPIKSGFTEISASYERKGKRHMSVKIVDVDYDENRRPLWKVVLEGEAQR